jgi:hypothetical protein
LGRTYLRNTHPGTNIPDIQTKDTDQIPTNIDL